MDKELFLYIFNFLLYLGLDIYLYRKKRSLLLLLMVSIWVLSSFVGIFYYLNPFAAIPYEPTIEPFLFLFGCFVITMIPFFVFNDKTIGEMKIYYHQDMFTVIIYVLALCSFVPFLEILYHIFKTGLSDLGSNYELLTSGTSSDRAHFSVIGKYMYSIEEYMKFISMPLLFAYLVCDRKKSKIITIGMILCAILPTLNNFANGQRYFVMITAFSFAFNYFLFSNMMSTELSTRIRKWAYIAGGGGIVLFLAISIRRFGEGSDYELEFGTTYQFLRYFGESFTRFNTEVWHLTSFMNGDFSLASFYAYFYGNEIDIQANNMKLGIISNNFYTYVGDFFIDFRYYSVLVVALLSVVFYRIANKVKSGSVRLGDLFLMNVYASIPMFGITYFVYRNGFVHLLWAIILSLIFNGLTAKRNYE